jgi:hypothetical protein
MLSLTPPESAKVKLSRNDKLLQQFQSKYGDRFSTVREYFIPNKHRVVIEDASPWVPELLSDVLGEEWRGVEYGCRCPLVALAWQAVRPSCELRGHTTAGCCGRIFAFSALLKYDGKPQPKNHKLKLERTRADYPDAFAAETTVTGNSTTYAPGADWNSLVTYYEEWIEARYEPFKMSAGAAARRVKETHAVVSSAMRFLAKKKGITAEQLEKQVSERAFGFDFSEVSAAVGDAHDFLFSEAEAAGDAYGAKLGVKLASATNYCDLDVTVGDEITQRILREDKDIAADAAMV